ncbi:hypothetical protein ACJX0J_010963, partial [Zea mays]
SKDALLAVNLDYLQLVSKMTKAEVGFLWTATTEYLYIGVFLKMLVQGAHSLLITGNIIIDYLFETLKKIKHEHNLGTSGTWMEIYKISVVLPVLNDELSSRLTLPS